MPTKEIDLSPEQIEQLLDYIIYPDDLDISLCLAFVSFRNDGTAYLKVRQLIGYDAIEMQEAIKAKLQ